MSNFFEGREMQTYKGYKFDKASEGVSVFHPRQTKPIYVAADEARAKRWVNAYRDGTTWAVMEARV
jgi:hypothetical protein